MLSGGGFFRNRSVFSGAVLDKAYHRVEAPALEHEVRARAAPGVLRTEGRVNSPEHNRHVVPEIADHAYDFDHTLVPVGHGACYCYGRGPAGTPEAIPQSGFRKPEPVKAPADSGQVTRLWNNDPGKMTAPVRPERGSLQALAG